MEITIPKGKRSRHQPNEFILNVHRTYKAVGTMRKTAKVLGISVGSVSNYVNAYKDKKHIKPKQKTMQKVYSKVVKDIRKRRKKKVVGKTQSWKFLVKEKDKRGRIKEKQPFFITSKKLSLSEKSSTQNIKKQINDVLLGIATKKKQGRQLTKFSAKLLTVLKGKAVKKYKYYHLTGAIIKDIYRKEINM